MHPHQDPAPNLWYPAVKGEDKAVQHRQSQEHAVTWIDLISHSPSAKALTLDKGFAIQREGKLINLSNTGGESGTLPRSAAGVSCR